jgi:hypothetical protein
MEFSPKWYAGFILGQFCGVATMANHPLKELAKFGYRSSKKLRRKV